MARVGIGTYTGEAHVSQDDHKRLVSGIAGKGMIVYDQGNCLSGEMVSANEFRLYDGLITLYGAECSILPGSYESLTIENGQDTYNRAILICAEYTKTDGVENVDFVVLNGDFTTGTPADPTYTTANMLEGCSLAQFPLYRITLSGITVSKVEKLFTVTKDINSLSDLLDRHETTCPKGSSSGITITASAVTARREGNWVELRCCQIFAPPKSNTKYSGLFTIPEGYRPADTQYVTALNISSNTTQGHCRYAINPNGTVDFTSSSTANAEHFFSLSYLTNDDMPD